MSDEQPKIRAVITGTRLDEQEYEIDADSMTLEQELDRSTGEPTGRVTLVLLQATVTTRAPEELVTVAPPGGRAPMQSSLRTLTPSDDDEESLVSILLDAELDELPESLALMLDRARDHIRLDSFDPRDVIRAWLRGTRA